jgi:hypothetical protein
LLALGPLADPTASATAALLSFANCCLPKAEFLLPERFLGFGGAPFNYEICVQFDRWIPLLKHLKSKISAEKLEKMTRTADHPKIFLYGPGSLMTAVCVRQNQKDITVSGFYLDGSGRQDIGLKHRSNPSLSIPSLESEFAISLSGSSYDLV